MASPELPGLADMHDQLLQLLARAHEIKPATTSEPPLPAAGFNGPQGIVQIPGFEHSHAALVEVAARRIFHDATSSLDIRDPEFVRIWNLLDILSICGDQEQCPAELIWWLIEELLEGQSVEGCRQVFDDYLDSRRNRLIAHHFSRKTLIILRGFNDLLRRVSRAEDAVFCGRILIYLFQSFDFGNRGAVNHRGDYNVDNVTIFDARIGQQQSDGSGDAIASTDDSPQRMEGIESTPAPNQTAAKPPQSGRDVKRAEDLYPLFWKLQTFFSNPPQVLVAENLQEFRTNVQEALKKFRDVPTIVETQSTGTKRKLNAMDADVVEENSSFNPKYLTSPDLFDLELSDLAFQRDFLVQALILIDFIQQQTPKLVGTLDPKSQTASEEAWAAELKRSIGKYLREGPDGPQYHRMVDTVLTREANWVRWKAGGCAIISKDAVSASEFKQAEEDAKDLSKTKRLRSMPMGTLDLGFLVESNRDHSIDQLKTSNRRTTPTLKGLIDQVGNTDLDLDMASGDEQKRLESVKENQTWSVLRNAVRSAYFRLDKIESGRKLSALIMSGEPESTGEGTVPEKVTPHDTTRNPGSDANNMDSADPMDNTTIEISV